jgi:sugar phosphate isomerase/epimerase
MHRIGTRAGYVDMDEKYYLGLRNHLDFLELSMSDGVELEDFNDYGIAVGSIHCAHFDGRGVNLADSALREVNVRELAKAHRAADMFGASRIVLHGERDSSDTCAAENITSILREYPDLRYCLENMPFEGFFGTSASELAAIANPLGIGFCLDVGHAACYAGSMGLNYEEYIRTFVALRPRQYHFSDNRSQLSIGARFDDAHLHLGRGSLDFELLLSLIPADSFITLETPIDIEGKLEDIALIRSYERS